MSHVTSLGFSDLLVVSVWAPNWKVGSAQHTAVARRGMLCRSTCSLAQRIQAPHLAGLLHKGEHVEQPSGTFTGGRGSGGCGWGLFEEGKYVSTSCVMISVIFLRILRICADLTARMPNPAFLSQRHVRLCALRLRQALCVAICLHLVLSALGEGNAEHADHVVVRGLHIHVRFDERLPPGSPSHAKFPQDTSRKRQGMASQLMFRRLRGCATQLQLSATRQTKTKPLLDQGADLVPGQGHSVEVGEAAAPLHLNRRKRVPASSASPRIPPHASPDIQALISRNPKP